MLIAMPNKVVEFDTIEAAIQKMAEMSYPLGGSRRAALSLEKCDFRPIRAMANQVEKELGFTEKQLELAAHLIKKYRKQMWKNGYGIDSILKSMVTVRPIRKIDDSRWVDVTPQGIVVRFRYSPVEVAKFKTFAAQISAGSWTFDPETKQWVGFPSLENMFYTNAFADKYSFEKRPAFVNTIDKLKWEYSPNNPNNKLIELAEVDGKFVIRNMPRSMKEWVDEHFGEITKENLAEVAVACPNLGVHISLTAQLAIDKIITDGLVQSMIAEKTVHIPIRSVPFVDLLSSLITLGQKTNVLYVAPYSKEYFKVITTDPRFYEDPTTKVKDLVVNDQVFTDKNNISKPNDNHPIIFRLKENPDRVFIFTSYIVPVIPDVLVSTSGYLFGPNRTDWITSAGKTIFYCESIKRGLVKKEYKLNVNSQNNSKG